MVAVRPLAFVMAGYVISLTDGIDPRIDFLVEGLDGPQGPEARAMTLTLKERRDEALERAQAHQKAYYDSKHGPVSFHEGDLV
jgi:hypothetical protein